MLSPVSPLDSEGEAAGLSPDGGGTDWDVGGGLGGPIFTGGGTGLLAREVRGSSSESMLTLCHRERSKSRAGTIETEKPREFFENGLWAVLHPAAAAESNLIP